MEKQLLTLVCLCQLANQEALVIMEKSPIREENLAEIFTSSRLELELRNDIYSTYRLQAPSHLNGTEGSAEVIDWALKKNVLML